MNRHKSLARILKVQDDLRRMAELRLAHLRHRAEQLENMEGQILQTLTRGDPRDFALAHMAGDRLRWLDRDLKENATSQRLAEAQLRELLTRKLACARAEQRARQSARAERERGDLQEVIEAFQAGCASFE
jgi:hypothetical protein